MRQNPHDVKPEPIDEIRSEHPTRQPHPADPRRCADGTQRAGAPGLATKHGAYAAGRRPPELAALVADLDDFRTALEGDQGGRCELTAIRAGYIQRLTEVEALCRLLGADLRARGIFTKRGRVRSTFAAFLQA